MSEFAIFETDEFLKRLDKQDPADRSFIRDKLDSFIYPQLRRQPFFGKNIRKLRGYSPDTWRYRVRSYRLFYSVDTDERIVYVLTIDDRKDAYK